MLYQIFKFVFVWPAVRLDEMIDEVVEFYDDHIWIMMVSLPPIHAVPLTIAALSNQFWAFWILVGVAVCMSPMAFVILLYLLYFPFLILYTVWQMFAPGSWQERAEAEMGSLLV